VLEDYTAKFAAAEWAAAKEKWVCVCSCYCNIAAAAAAAAAEPSLHCITCMYVAPQNHAPLYFM